MLSYCNQSNAQIAKKEIKTNIDILMMFFKVELFFFSFQEPEKERSYSKRLEKEKEAKKEMSNNTDKPLEKKTSAWKMIDGDWKDLSKNMVSVK